MNQLTRTLTFLTTAALLATTTFVGCSKSESDGDGGAGGGGESGGAGKGGTGSGGSGGNSGGSGGVAGGGGMAGGAGGAGGMVGGAGGAGGMAGAAGGMAGAAGGMAGAAGGMAAKMAQATIAPSGGGTITGTVLFVEKTNGVEVTYQLANCPAGMHETHIHAGTGCADANAQGMHWGPARGEGIGGTGKITCTAAMTGTLTYLRPNTDAALKWTIGGGAESDILTHPVVIHGLVTADRHGCGVIQLKN